VLHSHVILKYSTSIQLRIHMSLTRAHHVAPTYSTQLQTPEKLKQVQEHLDAQDRPHPTTSSQSHSHKHKQHSLLARSGKGTYLL